MRSSSLKVLNKDIICKVTLSGPMIPDYGKVPNNKTPIVSSENFIYFEY